MDNIYFRLIKIPQAKTKQNKTWIAKRDKQFTKVASLGNFSTNMAAYRSVYYAPIRTINKPGAGKTLSLHIDANEEDGGDRRREEGEREKERESERERERDRE